MAGIREAFGIREPGLPTDKTPRMGLLERAYTTVRLKRIKQLIVSLPESGTRSRGDSLWCGVESGTDGRSVTIYRDDMTGAATTKVAISLVWDDVYGIEGPTCLSATEVEYGDLGGEYPLRHYSEASPHGSTMSLSEVAHDLRTARRLFAKPAKASSSS